MEYKEIYILFVVMDQFHTNFVLSMCERTIIPILTVDTVFGVVRTELCFILVWTVELLNFVVAFWAIIAKGTHKFIVFIFNVLN